MDIEAKIARSNPIALIIGLCAAVLLILYPDAIWRVFGSADLGPVSFETVQRRGTPNDALACLPSICTTRIDIVPPVLPVSAQDLKAALARALRSEPRTIEVASDDASLTYRFVQRSRWLHFPDTIVVRLLEMPHRQSSVLIYSRSQMGNGDMGVNRARVQRWLNEIVAQAKPG